MSSSQTNRSRIWTLGIVSTALFMVVLDNLVVNVALPSIHRDLGSSIQSLEWTVNAYVLAYAVFLLTGAALGDRFGRKRMFLIAITLFTVSSAAAAVAPTSGSLIAARAMQGLGAAIATPLTLTLLADAFPPERRGLAIGVWSAISGIAVALGPLVGGAVVQAASWHWIFWINVPIGAVLVPLAARRLSESHGPSRRLDLVGLGLASTGLFGIVYGLVRSHRRVGRSPEILIALTAGTALVVAFIVYELRIKEPMLPMSFFAKRELRRHQRRLAGDVLRHVRVDLLPQPVPPERAPQQPAAGRASSCWPGRARRWSSRRWPGSSPSASGAGCSWPPGWASRRWRWAGWPRWPRSTSPTPSMVAPFVLAGAGMALVFAPSANAVLASVTTEQTGQASGATNAIRELGGVLGIAVLGTVFTSHGSYLSPHAFVSGLVPALWVGVAVLGAGSLLALALPFSTRADAAAQLQSPRPALRPELAEAIA